MGFQSLGLIQALERNVRQLQQLLGRRYVVLVKKHTWSAPARSKAVFALRAREGNSAGKKGAPTYQQLQSRCRSLMKKCGLRYKDHGFTELRLDDSRLNRLMKLLESPEFVSSVRLDSCWIEEPDVSSRSNDAWFNLLPGASEFKSAARPPANTEFSWGEIGYVASRKFRDVTEANGLTGLDWLPLENSRPNDRAEWFQVFAVSPLGRGLDHPLNETSKIDAERRADPEPRNRRRGEPVALLKNWRRDTKIDDPVVRELVRLSSPHFRQLFRVEGPARVVREHLPRADFAYFDWTFRNDPEPNRYWRGVYCSAKARQVLIESGVMKPSRFKGVAVVSASEANAVILDAVVKGPMPLPVFTKPEARRERARRTKILARSRNDRAPKGFRSIRQAVQALQAGRKSQTLPWITALDSSKFGAIARHRMFKYASKNWQLIAPLLPLSVQFASADGDAEFSMCPPSWNRWLPLQSRAHHEDLPSRHDLVLFRNRSGDWIAIRKSDPLLPRDARLVQWDHETLLISNEWATTVDFVNDALRLASRTRM